MSRDDLLTLLAELGIDDQVDDPEEASVLDALDVLAQASESPPPSSLLPQLLGAATGARPAGLPTIGAEPAGPLESFRSQIDVLTELFEHLDDDQWALPAHPYQWTLHELLGHLIGVEEYTGAVFGLWQQPQVSGSGDDHLARTDTHVAARAGRSPAESLAEWRALVDAVIDHVAQGGSDRLADEVTYEGWPFHVDSVLVARTFELWTHADDIRRAIGDALDVPAAPVLRAMSSVSVGSLPAAVLVVNPEQAGRAFKVVLTGPGGGTWQFGDPGAAPEATLVADVVDYCRVVARRIDPADLDADIVGDRQLVLDLLESCRLLAA